MATSLYGIDQENKSVWVYLEVEAGGLVGVSLELISKGRQMCDQLGWQLTGMLLGREVEKIAEEGFVFGLDEIWLGDDPLLEYFTIEPYAQAAFEALIAGQPSVFLLGATPNGRDLAGRLAVRLRTGLNADCTDLQINPQNGRLVCEVSGFGGGVLALIEMAEHRPQMATVRPGVFSPNEADRKNLGKIKSIPLSLTEGEMKTRLIQRSIGEGIDLTRVPVLVAGGRGVDGDFKMLEQLAQNLGGEIGATRPPVDEGYIERERQIGQTGAAPVTAGFGYGPPKAWK